jgi:hypothetical protein
MTEPEQTPRWHALQIGPGGLPAAEIRPSGPGAPWGQPSPPVWGLAPPPVPDRAPVNRTMLIIGIAVVALGVVVGLGFWVNSATPNSQGGASSVAVGQCLASSGERISGVVTCTSGSADFSVVGRYASSSDPTDCSATPSDVVVVGSGPTVLCLDYVAAVGECLYAGGDSTQVGKVDCSTTDPGVLRVTQILRNTIDPSGCPSGTSQTLVHRYNSQVLCLAAAK